MAFNLLSACTLDFKKSKPSPKVSMTLRQACIAFDKLSTQVESPAHNYDQVPWGTFLEQLENSLQKHTITVQQETKIPVSRSIQVQTYCIDDKSKTNRQRSGFLRIIDDYSDDKQFGILGQLISVAGGSDNVIADVTLQFGTVTLELGTVNDNIKLDLKEKSIAQCETMNAYQMEEWFDFPDSMAEKWTGSNKFLGTITLKLQLNDKARNLIRLDEQKGSPLRTFKNMLEDAESTGDGLLLTANGTSIPCHKAVLMAQSEVFKAMFTSGMKEHTSGTVELDNMSKNGVRALLAYLYCSDITEPLNDCGIAFELLKAADKYGFNNLHEVMKDLILNKEDSWLIHGTVSTAIKMWSFAKNKAEGENGDASGYKEIEKKAINMLKSKTQKKLYDCQEFQEMLTCPQFAMELCVYLLLNK